MVIVMVTKWVKVKCDIPLLKKQKQALLRCNLDRDSKDGILNMLDFIHDELDPPKH